MANFVETKLGIDITDAVHHRCSDRIHQVSVGSLCMSVFLASPLHL